MHNTEVATKYITEYMDVLNNYYLKYFIWQRTLRYFMLGRLTCWTCILSVDLRSLPLYYHEFTHTSNVTNFCNNCVYYEDFVLLFFDPKINYFNHWNTLPILEFDFNIMKVISHCCLSVLYYMGMKVIVDETRMTIMLTFGLS